MGADRQESRRGLGRDIEGDDLLCISLERRGVDVLAVVRRLGVDLDDPPLDVGSGDVWVDAHQPVALGKSG
jgi:hypothetical protein